MCWELGTLIVEGRQQLEQVSDYELGSNGGQWSLSCCWPEARMHTMCLQADCQHSVFRHSRASAGLRVG